MNIIHGGTINLSQNVTYTNNYIYAPITSTTAYNNFGYSKGINLLTLAGNYFFGGWSALYLKNCNNVKMEGNSIYKNYNGFNSSFYPNNNFYSSRPTGTFYRVRKNKYEEGRGHIVVYNFDGADFVKVDLGGTGILSENDYFKIVDVQNYFGKDVVSGKLTGGKFTVNIPMAGEDGKISGVSGVLEKSVVMRHTGKEFGVFVVMKSSDGVRRINGYGEVMLLCIGLIWLINFNL